MEDLFNTLKSVSESKECTYISEIDNAIKEVIDKARNNFYLEWYRINITPIYNRIVVTLYGMGIKK